MSEKDDCVYRAGDYDYRFCAVRGLERRKIYYKGNWENVTGTILETMTPEELRACANVMENRLK